ncbi:MAG TPA: SusC/RagA family TonB-linked outer membrane protein [Ohtaekwangia sp.]|uniref:SusC/RagA family TonB-linked outer membrane protein n=1 Tax=Ohtaekwangia sp. TaxID=2066019 RepID=UPI002F956994
MTRNSTQSRIALLLCPIAIILAAQFAFAQIPVKGKVTDETGVALPGVNVVVLNTTTGTVTDADGKYELSVNNGSAVLVFSFIGYSTTRVPVENRAVVDVVLNTDVKSLEEVVITALGVEREKRELTYSTQAVKGDELMKAKEPSVLNSLTGKVAGVQITSSSGTPGSSTRIVVRGATSIFGDNQALIVVDGVPVNNNESGLLGEGYAGSSRVVDIDPAVIENVNVLKGAAATALYGSAGARGVVMITTKGGSERKPLITFSSGVSFEKGIFPERQTKYAQGTNGIYYNGEDQKISASWGPLMDTLMIDGKRAPKYDPYSFFKTGITTNNTVSISGGNNSSSYFISYSYFDQKGIVKNSDFKRHSFFTKYTSTIRKNLTSTFQLQYTHSDQDRVPEGFNGPLFVLYGQPVSWNPNPYLNPDGSQRLYRYSRNNPQWVQNNYSNDLGVNRFIPVITLNYTPFSWLSITERLGADMYTEQIKFWEAPSANLGTLGRIIDQNSNFRQFNNDLIISATKETDNFSYNLLLGANIYSTYTQTLNETGSGLSIDGYHNIAGAASIKSSEYHSLRRKVGSYAQANITYKHLLTLSLTGRYDGSSVLAKNKTYYPYGSVAASFVFSELLPASITNVLSFGKLRLSQATVGNENVDPYSINTTYYSSNVNGIAFPFQGQAGFMINKTIGNTALHNERLNESEIGLETKFFNNRIGLEASYFYRKSIDGLIPGVAIAPSSGYTGTTVNSASIENKGIEILLNATPVKSQKFSWDLTFNFTRIRNKVLSIYPGTDQLGRIVKGQPYNIFYGTRYKRNENGSIVIGTDGLPLPDDLPGVIGNANPKWLAGLTNNFRYGQFTLSFFFDMKKGGDIQNDMDSYGYFYGSSKVTENRAPRVIEGVSVADNQPNTVSVGAQKYYQYITSIQESLIQDGTYIKLRSVSLGYELNPAWLARTPFKSASITISGRNLWIYSPHFSGADPEVSSLGAANGVQSIYQFSTPTSRSGNCTLKFSF